MTFELGLNYWPRRTAMYMWRELDLVEVRDEVQHIAAMGFDVVRLFLLTRDFIPAPRMVDATTVARLVDVCRIAADAGLRVMPTLIVLNMSGRIWWPDWMCDAQGRPGNLYEDAALFDTQVLLAQSCARALAGSGRRTLMQEFGLCTAPPSMPGITITDAFLGTPRPQYLASEDEAATYYEAVLERLVRTGAAGGYAWCYADYDARLHDRPPFDTALRERTFGLVRADGSEKPATAAFRALRAHRDAGTLGAPRSHSRRSSTSVRTPTTASRRGTSRASTHAGSRARRDLAQTAYFGIR